MRSPLFAQIVGGIVFTARDSMGADSGISWLSTEPTKVLALSGVLSASPLQSKEAKMAIGLPVYTIEDLLTPEIAMNLIGQARKHLESYAEPYPQI